MKKTFNKTKSLFFGGVKRGQSVLEYSIIVAIVSAAFLAMSMYISRAVSGTLLKIEGKVVPQKKVPGVSGWGGGGGGWYPVPI